MGLPLPLSLLTTRERGDFDMIVQFAGVGEWKGQGKTLDMLCVPRVGDHIEIEHGDQAVIRTVVWDLTADEPSAYVVFGQARPR